MIIPMLCVTIFVILVVWFLLPRVARLMIHTPTAISIFVCLSMVQLMAVFISMRCTLCGDRKSGSAGMPRPISYAVFCLEKKTRSEQQQDHRHPQDEERRMQESADALGWQLLRLDPPQPAAALGPRQSSDGRVV